MSTKDTGEPAFPILERGGSGLELTHPGMSLRDHFAGLAMQAMASGTWPDEQMSAGIASLAFAMADAMLKERAK